MRSVTLFREPRIRRRAQRPAGLAGDRIHRHGTAFDASWPRTAVRPGPCRCGSRLLILEPSPPFCQPVASQHQPTSAPGEPRRSPGGARSDLAGPVKKESIASRTISRTPATENSLLHCEDAFAEVCFAHGPS